MGERDQVGELRRHELRARRVERKPDLRGHARGQRSGAPAKEGSSVLTAAQLPSHVRGKPLLQLEASAQQTLFSWFVMALRAERGSAGSEAPVRGQRRL